MDITMKSDRISKEYMHFLYHLLPRYMQELSVQIAVVESVEQGKAFIEKAPDTFWELVEKRYFLAGYQPQTNRIVLFVQNFDEDEHFYNRVAHSFFHEFRHAYQYYYVPDIFHYESKLYDQDARKDTYSDQWLERDANYFAYEILHQNKQELLQFLGTDVWKVKRIEAASRHPVMSKWLITKPKKWRLFA